MQLFALLGSARVKSALKLVDEFDPLWNNVSIKNAASFSDQKDEEKILAPFVLL